MDYLDHDIQKTEGIKFEDGKITYIVKYTQKDVKVGSFITVGPEYILRLHKMGRYTSIGNIVIWMPITNGSFVEVDVLMRIIEKMIWSGKLIMYDVKCKSTEKWIQKLYRYDRLLLCNVYDVPFSKDVFKIVWDKIGKQRQSLEPKFTGFENTSNSDSVA